MNDNVVQFPGAPSRRQDDPQAFADALFAPLGAVDGSALRAAVLRPGAELRSRELAVIALAARLAEGISTISLRAGNKELSLAKAYERFEVLAHLADLAGSIARYADGTTLEAATREAFLEVTVADLLNVARRFAADLPDGWCDLAPAASISL